MARPLLITALLAWVLIQVPLVHCESPCSQSVGVIFLMTGHSCHNDDADAHQAKCGRHGDEECPDGPASEDEDGEHVLLQIEALTSGPVTGLPDSGGVIAACFAADGCDIVESLLVDVESASRDLDPPPRPAPVAIADRLIV